MSDQLYLSYWLKGFSPIRMNRQFEKLLETFPFSKLATAEPVLRVHAISFSEPALIETPLPAPLDPVTTAQLAAQFQNSDCCFEVTGAWDIWHLEREWKLAPAAVRLACFGPDFDTELGDNLRIDFGIEDQFLPAGDSLEGLPMIRANVQSLLRLVHDMDERFDVEHRLLWSESGGNFAERLQTALAGK